MNSNANEEAIIAKYALQVGNASDVYILNYLTMDRKINKYSIVLCSTL